MEDEPTSISITVCGDGGTGKSSISLRLVRSKWTHEYDPTVQDSYSVTRIVDGRTYHLNLTDTAGQEEYRGLWAASNLEADAYLLVYDITVAESLAALDYFNDLVEMESEERMLKPNAVPHIKIVAGNKCDLANSRAVSSAEGLEWARNHDCGFMETSARNVVNIEETFELIVRRVVAARQAVKEGKPWGAAALAASDEQKEKDDREKNEVSGMDDYDSKRERRWGCCSIM
ncbi:P-loop containing nucleoside triphosphate hydrolase protein [Pyronema omphalodes]|nr:P-loop containing nucleoside triphosphate hydrolase protein [Pyronema omphalodes]